MMKKLVMMFALLCSGVASVQAQISREQMTPKFFATVFEQLYQAGFMLGLSDAEHDPEAYFQLAGAVNHFPPKKIMHQSFLTKLPNIDPLNVHKQVRSPEEFSTLTVGDQKEFGFGFLLAGYQAAIEAVNREKYVLRKYHDQEIVVRCKFIYDALLIAGMEKGKQMK